MSSLSFSAVFQHLKDKFGEPSITANDDEASILNEIKITNDNIYNSIRTSDVNGEIVEDEDNFVDFEKEQFAPDNDEPIIVEGVENQESDEDVVAKPIEELKEVKSKKKKKILKEEDRISRDKGKHPILPPCDKNCKRSCKERLTDEMRRNIHQNFWTQNYNDRRVWIRSKVTETAPKRERKLKKGDIERKTRIYHFEGENGKVIVCQRFFLSTLGFLKDHVVKTAINSAKDVIVPAKDKRGVNTPANKISAQTEEKVRVHIFKFGPSVSHYRRAHAPNRLYISPEFDCRFMHRDYIEEFPEYTVSYAYYYKVLKSLNISFVKLGEEECEKCELQSKHLLHEHPELDVIEPETKRRKTVDKRSVDGCETCMIFKVHIDIANRCREEYKKDKERKLEEKEVVVSTDMQKVVMLPRMPGLKLAIFTRRLVAFHQTFSPLGGKGKSVGVIWHEGIRGRDAKDVSSTFIKFMRDTNQRDKDHFIIWADNCSAQNKNWWLFTALVTEVNRTTGPLSVTIKYLEPGHTFMSADSFHHQIELCMKKRNRVDDFADFKHVIDSKGVALEATYDDFYKIPRGVSSGKFAEGKPKMADIQVVKFVKGSKLIYWKKSFDDVFRSAVFLQRKISKLIDNSDYFDSHDEPRGVHPEKIDDIILKLCPFMEANRRKFWIQLKAADVEDLCLVRGFDEDALEDD